MAPHGATFESIAFGYLCIPEVKKKKGKKKYARILLAHHFLHSSISSGAGIILKDMKYRLLP